VKKFLVTSVFLFATIGSLVVMLVMLPNASDSDSNWDVVSRQDIPSPDGRHVATVFEMCSYNTTGYWPQLSLHRPGEKLTENGNVLSCGPTGLIKAQWLSSRELAVEYHYYEEWTPPNATNIDGVTITFKKVAPQEGE
jgi:hypothetical protein